MTIYFIYCLVALILLFVICIAFKAVMRGFEAKQNYHFINEKNNNKNMKVTSTKVLEEIQQLKKLHEDGTLDDNEFKKAKDKILNS